MLPLLPPDFPMSPARNVPPFASPHSPSVGKLFSDHASASISEHAHALALPPSTHHTSHRPALAIRPFMSLFSLLPLLPLCHHHCHCCCHHCHCHCCCHHCYF